MARNNDGTTARFSTAPLVLAGFVAVLLLAAAQPLGVAAQEMEEERFTAFARHIGTGPTGATTVQITISRWSTEEERVQLFNVLKDSGHEDLANALRKHDETGFIRFPGVRTRFPSTRLYFAHQFQQGDTRVIRLATDRPIGFLEAVNRPRSIDYDLSLVELRLPPSGDENGEGVLAVGVEITFDDEEQSLTIEHLSTSPVQLSEVRRTN